MAGYWYPPDDHAPDAYQPAQGSAHSVSSDAPDADPAERVRKVAEEVSRKPIPRVPLRRIGF